MDSNTTTDIDGPLYLASTCLKQVILDYSLTACLQQVAVGLNQKNNQFLITFGWKWRVFVTIWDCLMLYDLDDVIGRADRFGFQNFCSPDYNWPQNSDLLLNKPLLELIYFLHMNHVILVSRVFWKSCSRNGKQVRPCQYCLYRPSVITLTNEPRHEKTCLWRFATS